MIAIISDIHGNYPALKAVLSDIEKRRVDTILSLGDVAGYYCMLNECITALKERKIINIMGNHDAYLIGSKKCERSTTANLCIEFQRERITPESFNYLYESKEGVDTDFFSARHGGWKDSLDEYVESFDFRISKKFKCNVFMSGHTHIQKIERKENVLYFNPGAVGQPRDKDCRAAYALLDQENVQLIRVEYDIDEIAFEMKRNGFNDRVYDCLYYGEKIGERDK